MNNQSSITALMSAFCRAYHNETEAFPVFEDSFAKKLLTDEEFENMKNYILGGIDFFAPDKKDCFSDNDDALRYIINTHLAPTPLCRASYCEDAISTAVKTGTTQIVILGAGFDTFAFRNNKNVSIFEVDHPLTQKDKISRLEKANIEIPENVTFVPVDFSKDNLKEKLLDGGFDTNKKTFFSWLGVSYYLYFSEIENLIKSLSELSAEGSTLLFDYGDAVMFLSDDKRVQNMIAMAKASGEEMKSSFDYLSIDQLLAKYGFLVYEVLEPKDIQSQIINPTLSNITAFPHINYIQAVLKQ